MGTLTVALKPSGTDSFQIKILPHDLFFIQHVIFSKLRSLWQLFEMQCCMLLKCLTIRQHLDPLLLLVVILCWWCLVAGKLGSIRTRAALSWRVQALWKQRPQQWVKSSSNGGSAGRHCKNFLQPRILTHPAKQCHILFMQSLSDAYERSNSGNTDWFAFIRAQCRVLVVGPGQGWEVFVVNGEVLRLFVRWLCDHSNYGETHFDKGYCEEIKIKPLTLSHIHNTSSIEGEACLVIKTKRASVSAK